MDWALVLAAALIGAAGSPHCVAMCAAPCHAIARGCGGAHPQQALAVWHLGRLLAYAAAGALAAAGTGALFDLARASAWLRPLWTLLQVAGLVLGLWLLFTGRLPFQALGRGPVAWLPMRGPDSAVTGRTRRLPAFGLGLAWVGWPCGLLYAALAVATLAQSAWSGALVMAAFALASAGGLVALPLLLARMAGRGERVAQLAVRGAGALLVTAGLWALLQTLRAGGAASAWCLPS